MTVKYLRAGREQERQQRCSLGREVEVGVLLSWMRKGVERVRRRARKGSIFAISRWGRIIIVEIKMEALNCRFIGEFEKGEIIGEGTYGIVFLARDKQTNEQLAIKKMKVLDNQDGFPITSLREVKILRQLANHPNIVGLR